MTDSSLWITGPSDDNASGPTLERHSIQHYAPRSLTPLGLKKMLDFQSTPDEQLPSWNILDLTEVPYMDSAGLGIVVSHYVSCQRKGVRLIAAGVGPRVRELLKITKLDTTIAMTATVDEADTR
jgi:anti-anti-sigma factor